MIIKWKLIEANAILFVALKTKLIEFLKTKKFVAVHRKSF